LFRLRSLTISDYLCLSALALTLALTSASSASATTRTIELDGSGDYTVIQEALFASTKGDTVLVGPGTYTWTNQGSGDDHGMVRYWLSEQDEVTLLSTHGPEATILDAEGQGRIFFANGNNVTNDPVNFLIRGFTMRNGYAPKVPNRDEQEGGAIAMHLCEAIVENCIFENNEAEYGGAVWLGGVGAYDYRNCIFRNNVARLQKTGVDYRAIGGGVFVGGSPQRTTFENCTFTDNHAQYRGGGLMITRGNIEIRDCLFAGNSASAGPTRHGTAIYAFEARFLRMNRVTVRNHDSAPGASVLVLFAEGLELDNSLIAGNSSGVSMHVQDSRNVSAHCTNIHGGVLGNWLGDLAPMRLMNGNMELDPLFCSDEGDLTRVELASPMLAANNSCGTDVGLIQESCVSVPILAAGLRAQRRSGEAVLQWEGVEPVGAGIVLQRSSDAGPTSIDLGRANPAGMGRWSIEDRDAPQGEVGYRLLDRNGHLLARATLPSAGGIRLLRASPNPFNPRTQIAFDLAEAGHARLEVFDSRGRRVAVLVDEERPAGRQHALFSGQDASGRALGSGVYHLRLQSAGQVRTDSVVLLR